MYHHQRLPCRQETSGHSTTLSPPDHDAINFDRKLRTCLHTFSRNTFFFTTQKPRARTQTAEMARNDRNAYSGRGWGVRRNGNPPRVNSSRDGQAGTNSNMNGPSTSTPASGPFSQAPTRAPASAVCYPIALISGVTADST